MRLGYNSNQFFLKINFFFFLKIELFEHLSKYICVDCNSALESALEFKSKISKRIEEIRILIELSMKPIKNEVIFDIEEVILHPDFQDQFIKVEEEESPTLPSPSLKEPKKTKQKPIKKKTRTCIYCQKELGSYAELAEHNSTHTECLLCNKKYKNFKCFRVHYREKHMNVQRKNVDKKFSCELCDQQFLRKKNVVVHVRRYHNNERKYVCEICDKGFYERTAWEAHKSVHTTERAFVCETCKKTFKSHKSLRIHLRTHNESEANQPINNYMCTYCGKQIRSLSGFIGHQRLHTKELPYECKVCNKKHRIKSSLTAHLRIHTGEKPYKCTICPKRFRMYHFLKNHKLSHGGKNTKKFFCKLCAMSTVYKENLDTHMRTVHMQITNFDCKICTESFTKISLFKAHMMDTHNILS